MRRRMRPTERVAACGASATFFLLLVSWARSGSTAGAAIGAEVPTDLRVAAADAHMALYSVAHWDDASLGNHRARLHLAAPADGLAWARVQWRLPVPDMRQRQLILYDEAGGWRIRNVHVVHADAEGAELLFEPSPSSRDYLLYYLPYRRDRCITGAFGDCSSPYVVKRDSGSRGWFRDARATIRDAPKWHEKLPRAQVVALQARTERDAFHPMEVMPTSAELAAVRALGRRLIVWPEDRRRPIRMTEAPPLIWLGSGVPSASAGAYAGVAARGEFFTFQLGAYAPLGSITVKPRWGALRGRSGASLPASAMRCVNTPAGSVAARDGIPIGRGEVLPLWFGIDVPADARADTYEGAVVVVGAGDGGAVEERVRVAVTVEGGAPIVAHGDDDLWRHSRLRWLDSTAGADGPAGGPSGGAAPAPPPVDAISWDASTSTLRATGGRSIRLNRHGLPKSLTVGTTELLAAPARLDLVPADGQAAIELKPSAPVHAAADAATGAVSWSVSLAPRGGGGSCGGVRAVITGRQLPGGVAQMSASLTVGSGECALSDAALVLPLRAAEIPLINGFGYKGAARPAHVDWRWDTPVDHAQRGLNCRVWLGTAAAGLQLNLQGTDQATAAAASHCGNDENGVLQCDDLTDAQFNVALGSMEWFNSNRGSASVHNQPSTLSRRLSAASDVAALTVRTGALTLRAGKPPLELQWRLLLTPVAGGGAPVRADFATRYFHMQRFYPVSEALAAAGAAYRPWIILHQGNQLNPYINYPFLTLGPLRRYIAEAHKAGARVKLYYTVREISTSMTELWALRALRGEVLVPSSRAQGHVWLREHVRTNYTAAWHEVLSDGEVDAAIQTPAFTSRWDNYWVEGILWLAKNLEIDGIYLDGAPYEYTILRRLRRALEPILKGREFKLDIHASCYGNPHLPYVELYPYLDSIWFGEQCNYKAYSPEQWLAEVSGVPFGLPGQILGDNSDQWHGLLFGMTCRIYPDPHRCNPRPLYQVFDELGLSTPTMIGWWDPSCPVRATHASARATLFDGGGGKLAIAIAGWDTDDAIDTGLEFDWAALAKVGLRSTPESAQLIAKPIKGFQPRGSWAARGASLTIQRKGSGFNEGWLLELR